MSAKKRPGDENRAGKSEKQEETLALVLKADTVGTSEAVISSLEALHTGDVFVQVIDAGTGNVSKSDLFMAEAGSRLVIGFNVDLLPKIKELSAEKGIEIRLHDVIYKLLTDIQEIAGSMVPYEEEEKITGRARVIALFPGGQKGIILGCEVLDGTLAVGKKFRLISDPGTVYEGKIGSLHIEKRAVKEAKVGQQVGLKISGFKRAKKGDLVECFETIPPKRRRWQPRGGVFDLRSDDS
jgi:translation initiation factor IF-2